MWQKNISLQKHLIHCSHTSHIWNDWFFLKFVFNVQKIWTWAETSIKRIWDIKTNKLFIVANTWQIHRQKGKKLGWCQVKLSPHICMACVDSAGILLNEKSWQQLFKSILNIKAPHCIMYSSVLPHLIVFPLHKKNLMHKIKKFLHKNSPNACDFC